MPSPLSCVISTELTAEQLIDAVAELERKYKRTKRFKSYADSDAVVEFASEELPSLVGVVEADRLSVRTPTASAASQEALINVGLVAAKNGAMRVVLAWQTSSPEFTAGHVLNFDLRISAGLARRQYYCGLYAAFENSPGYADIAARRDLFQRAIAALGFAGEVDASIRDGILTMTCAQPWLLDFPVAAPGGKNPLAFNIGGLASMEDAVLRAVELSHSSGDRIAGITCAIQSELAAYEQMRPILADTWRGWVVETDGPLTSAASEILTGKSASSPKRCILVPAFTWHEANEGSLVSGAVITDNDRCRLQISSPDVSTALLLQSVAFVQNARFDAVGAS